MKRKRKSTRRAGWTVLELSIAAVLASLVVGKAVFVLRSASRTGGTQSTALALEDRARSVMDRIAVAIMGSDRGTLIPTLEGIHNNRMRYKFSLGLEDGEVVWSDPEEILFDEAGLDVVWTRDSAAANDVRVVWANEVGALLEGEIDNGVDDNGNGLVDEQGLSFELDGNSVVIRLSLQRQVPGGPPVTETIESIVTCRN